MNPDAAISVRSGILESVGHLKSFPLLGAAYEERSKSTIRELFSSGYRIFHRADAADPVVLILTIRHPARREPKFR